MQAVQQEDTPTDGGIRRHESAYARALHSFWADSSWSPLRRKLTAARTDKGLGNVLDIVPRGARRTRKLVDGKCKDRLGRFRNPGPAGPTQQGSNVRGCG